MRAKEVMKFKDFYSKKNIVDSYDAIRLSYFHRRIHRRLERFAASLYLRKGNILEVGCGTGFITSELVKHGKVLAVDPSEYMLELARIRIGNKARFERKSAFSINYKDKFDYVVSFRVLNHFRNGDIIKVLKKMKNAVKKEGIMIFTLENKSWLRSVIQRVISRNKAPAYKHSLDDIDRLTGKTGLKLKDVLAIQHTWLLLPLHFIGEIVRSKKYENFVFNLESMLFHLKLWNNDWVIICQKSYS